MHVAMHASIMVPGMNARNMESADVRGSVSNYDDLNAEKNNMSHITILYAENYCSKHLIALHWQRKHNCWAGFVQLLFFCSFWW